MVAAMVPGIEGARSREYKQAAATANRGTEAQINCHPVSITPMPALSLNVLTECWPIAGTFTISRGSKTQAEVVVAELGDGVVTGRGECVPYARYGETVAGVADAIAGLAPAFRDGLDREELQSALPAGAARNALDCALWDYEAKRSGTRVHVLAGLPTPEPRATAYTISFGAADDMAAAARAAAQRPLLKIKLGGDGVDERISAVRAAAPNATLIVDANEAWHPDTLARHLAACANAGVTLVEQPLPAGSDDALAAITRPVPVCADESVHDRASLAALVGKYDVVNIKLDKTGGLTEALRLAREAERLGFDLMVGCMVSTSLSIAPAMLVAQRARFVDLDGALLLMEDRPVGLVCENSRLHPPSPELWG
jgi:L-alanine-DL-glutamate epimerase-like enolase superfamily enzyme